MNAMTCSWKMKGMKYVMTGTGPANAERLSVTYPGLQRDGRGCRSADTSHPLWSCWLLVKWKTELKLRLGGLPSLQVVSESVQRRRMPEPSKRLEGGAEETTHG